MRRNNKDKNQLLNIVRHSPIEVSAVLLAVIVIISIGLLQYGLVGKRSLNLSFSKQGSCLQRLTVLPTLYQPEVSENLDVYVADLIQIGPMIIASKLLCVSSSNAPTPNSTQRVGLLALDGWLGGVRFDVETSDMPRVAEQPFDNPIPASRSSIIKLDTPDEIFQYNLAVGSRNAGCDLGEESMLVCDIAELELKQGTSYAVDLVRRFDGEEIDRPLQTKLKTTTPVVVKKSSIKNQQVVYSSPSAIEIYTDKQVNSVDAQLVENRGKTTRVIPVTTAIDGKKVTVKFGAKLTRSAKFELILSKVSAIDGSELDKPQNIEFRTSGGPMINYLSVGSYDVDTSASVIIGFDYALSEAVDPLKFIRVAGATTTISRISDRSIKIQLLGSDRCKTITVTVKKGIQNKHGIPTTSDQTRSFTTRCYTISTIGYSVEGRPINAYYFGSGNRRILFTGAIHGNEISSRYILESWIRALNAAPHMIPSGTTVVIVTTVNPDGVNRGARTNARGINLNRNFPTYNWTSNIVTSTGEQEGAGGETAASEPETRAIMQLTAQLNPELVVTFHSSGSLVNSNDIGTSIREGKEYASLAGYRYVSNAQTAQVFGFEMTGTYEDWLAERGTGAILIELDTDTGNHFYRNQSALWTTLR